MAEVRFPVFFVARTVIKRDLISCFPVPRQVVLCQLHSQMTQFELLCKHISAQSVSKDCVFIHKQQKQRSVIVFVSLSLSPFDCLFSGLSQFSSHSLLCPPMPPVVVETTAVRILSGVGYYL